MSDLKFLILLGARIRQFRLERNLTQTELASLCEIEKASLSRIESGKSNITLLTLKKISTALELDIVDFFKSDSL